MFQVSVFSAVLIQLINLVVINYYYYYYYYY